MKYHLRNYIILALALLSVLLLPQCMQGQIDNDSDTQIHDTPGHISGESLRVTIELNSVTIIHVLGKPALLVITRDNGSTQYETIFPSDMPKSSTFYNKGKANFVKYKIYRPEGGFIAAGMLKVSSKK